MAESTSKRNKEIFEKRKSGMSYRSIGREYGLPASRVMQIVDNLDRKRGDRKRDMELDPLMALLTEAAESVGSSTVMAARAYNVLARHGYGDVSRIVELDVSEVIGWKNVGFATEDVIATAYDMAKEVV